MRVSIRFVLKTQKQNKQGYCPIYLRVYSRGKTRYMSCNIKIKQKDWNDEKEEVRRSHERCVKLNEELHRIYVKAENAALELKRVDQLDADSVIKMVRGYDIKDFFGYAEEYRDTLDAQGRVRLKKQTQVTINKIRDFTDGGPLAIDQIDRKFLERFQLFLKQEYENAINTINKEFERLKQITNQALKDRIILQDPFEKFDPPSRQRSKNTALTFDQIQAIEDLDLTPGSRLWHTRNYFLFSFYNAGIRFGDLCKLKGKNIVDGRLKYLMSKTQTNAKPKWKNIKLQPPAIQILEYYNYQGKGEKEYLFPILDTCKNLEDPVVFDRDKQSKNAMANRALKKIAARAGIDENLTTHVARHSFALHGLKNKVHPHALKNALAHSSLKTLEIYLKDFDEELLDEEMGELFG